jgi:hypothetical protein
MIEAAASFVSTACAVCGALEGQSIGLWELFYGSGAVLATGGVSLASLSAQDIADSRVREWNRGVHDPEPGMDDPQRPAWDNRRRWEDWVRANWAGPVWIEYGTSPSGQPETVYYDAAGREIVHGGDWDGPAPPR